MKKIFLIFAIITLLFVSNVAMAQEALTNPAPDGLVPCGKAGLPDCDFDQFLILIVRIYQWLLYIVGPIATASIAYAGVLYALYSTSDSKRKQAHDIITMAIFGLGIALAGYLIITQLFYLLVDDVTESRFKGDPKVQRLNL